MSESCFQPVVLRSLVTSSGGLLYLKRVAMRCQTLIHFWKLECLDSSFQALLLVLDDVLVGTTRLARQGFSFYIACAFTLSDTHLLAVEGGK